MTKSRSYKILLRQFNWSKYRNKRGITCTVEFVRVLVLKEHKILISTSTCKFQSMDFLLFQVIKYSVVRCQIVANLFRSSGLQVVIALHVPSCEKV